MFVLTALPIQRYKVLIIPMLKVLGTPNHKSPQRYHHLPKSLQMVKYDSKGAQKKAVVKLQVGPIN